MITIRLWETATIARFLPMRRAKRSRPDLAENGHGSQVPDTSDLREASELLLVRLEEGCQIVMHLLDFGLHSVVAVEQVTQQVYKALKPIVVVLPYLLY